MSKTKISTSMHTLRFTPVKAVTVAHSATNQDCLEHESHTFIVAFGAILGGIIAAFVGYHLQAHFLNYALLCVIPILVAYSLRRIYIHTLTHAELD
mgnify:FL=1